MFTKEFFQQAWGEGGYVEPFSYGVGYHKVCEVGIYPFLGKALEIGSGGGTFTEKMLGRFDLTVVDVIKKPPQFNGWDLTYIELPDQSNDLPGIKDGSIDFCFSYNVFCHLSNDFIKGYLKSVRRVLKTGGNFVFMLANFEHSKAHLNHDNYKLGQLLDFGHYYQDDRTIDLIVGEGWEIVNRNLLPDHRDILVHLKSI